MTDQNGVIWIDGTESSWEHGRVPLMSDAVLSGCAVFDAMVAVRQPRGEMGIVALERHLRRLFRSLRTLGIATKRTFDELATDCLGAANAEADRNACDWVYVRPMIVGYDLSLGSKTGCSATVAAFAIEPGNGEPVSLMTSALRRPPNASLPPSVKATANYAMSRVVRMQARAAGYDDGLLLNSHGRVAETAGAAVLIENDRSVMTPPVYEDCLPSVTTDLVGMIAEELGITFTRQPLLLTDVYQAVAVSTGGTLGGLRRVTTVDHCGYTPAGTHLDRLADAYIDAVTGHSLSKLVEIVVS